MLTQLFQFSLEFLEFCVHQVSPQTQTIGLSKNDLCGFLNSLIDKNQLSYQKIWDYWYDYRQYQD